VSGAEDISIRPADEADLPTINAIYNHYVLHSTCTFQVQPDSLEDTRRWSAEHDELHPIVVAELDGEVVGWGSLSAYHTRCAYRQTVENSVYVRDDLRGRGIGTRLMDDLMQRARALGHHSIIALICVEHPGSIALHHTFGFDEVGRTREVGHKFGRWLDVVIMQKRL
jgi:L-amino acid N-acyltransferase YncA